MKNLLIIIFCIFTSLCQAQKEWKKTLDNNINIGFQFYSEKSQLEFSEDIKHGLFNDVATILESKQIENSLNVKDCILLIETYFDQYKNLNEIKNKVQSYKSLEFIIEAILKNNIRHFGLSDGVREKENPPFISIFSGYATLVFEIDPSAVIDVFLNGIKVNLSNPSEKDNLKIKVHAGENYTIKVMSKNKKISLGSVKLKSEEIKVYTLKLK